LAAFEGAEEAVGRMKAEMKSLADDAGALHKVYLDDDEHRSFWSRYRWAEADLSGDQNDAISVKLNYPVSCYRDVLEFVESAGMKNNAHLASYTHAGSGVTRIHLLVEDGSKDRFERILTWTRKLLMHVHGLGGNLVVEHAGRELKKTLPVWGAVRDDLKMMQWIKKAMDPEGIFSPGRFVGNI